VSPARNAAVSGSDGRVSGSSTYLAELSEAIRLGTCRPQPAKRVEIPKGPGKTRPLGIPVVKDRIVQTALKMVVEPIFERAFLDSSYGFRPGRGCKDALRGVDGRSQ
jgi:RNA-directed DNA polymerase